MLPFIVAICFTADHASFPRIIFGASLAQLAAFGAVRLAARELVRRRGPREETADVVAVSATVEMKPVN